MKTLGNSSPLALCTVDRQTFEPVLESANMRSILARRSEDGARAFVQGLDEVTEAGVLVVDTFGGFVLAEKALDLAAVPYG